MKYFDDEDTIVALSTPWGRGAVAVIRLSGRRSLKIINTIFTRKISTSDHKKVFTGKFISRKSGEIIDTVVVVFFRAPHSYTGEDVVEISSHANHIIIDQIINEILFLGARVARPGEFTKRAFLNQKMDLAQAEAVANVIDSKTKQSLKYSLRQLEGRLSERINRIKSATIDVASLIEVSLDFNENDIEIYNEDELHTKVKHIIQDIDRLIEGYQYGHLLKQGIKMVLLGKPNVGKSSLLNVLLEKDRAIVSHIPGTTRDYIEETIEIGGIPICVVDTAGVRQTEDTIEKKGVYKTLDHVATSDIVLAMFEASKELDDNDRVLFRKIEEYRDRVRILILLNKIDLGVKKGVEKSLRQFGFPVVKISAKLEENIDDLRREIQSLLLSNVDLVQEEVVVTNARHKNALLQAKNSLIKFLENLARGSEEVILAADLRSALDFIGEIIGETSTEDLLNNIFGQFCIGK